jgi:pSer/pThr/pTyr-binding forkhead associated (FHA) protein
VAVTLIVSTSGSAPQSITLDQPRVVVGRGAHVDVRLPSREVSAQHATIRAEGSDFVLLDEGSTNGTRVNGAVVPRGRKKVLHAGDVIDIASFSLRVDLVIARPDPPERTASLARRLLLDALATAEDASPAAQIIVVSGRLAGQEWPLAVPSRLVIGRGDGCDILLDDRDASRQHVEIVRDTDGVTARDLGSKNGFLLGGRAVTERKLRHGDEITVGRTVLRYHEPAEELLRALEAGQDDVAPPRPSAPPAATASPAPVATPVATAEAPAPSTTSEITSTESAKPAPSATTSVSKSSRARAAGEWLILVVSVAILVVCAAALAIILRTPAR